MFQPIRFPNFVNFLRPGQTTPQIFLARLAASGKIQWPGPRPRTPKSLSSPYDLDFFSVRKHHILLLFMRGACFELGTRDPKFSARPSENCAGRTEVFFGKNWNFHPKIASKRDVLERKLRAGPGRKKFEMSLGRAAKISKIMGSRHGTASKNRGTARGMETQKCQNIRSLNCVKKSHVEFINIDFS